MNREAWLERAKCEIINRVFIPAGYELKSELIAVSCGWPSSSPKKVVGESWPNDQSDGGIFEIFISPMLDKAGGESGVLSVLVHELLHVAVGHEHKHKAPFKKAMKLVGLEGKPTSTTAMERLVVIIDDVVNVVGPYPHKKLNHKLKPAITPVKSLTKMRCPKDDCDYIIMVKTRLVEEKGVPKCPVHDVKFEEEVIDDSQ